MAKRNGGAPRMARTNRAARESGVPQVRGARRVLAGAALRSAARKAESEMLGLSGMRVKGGRSPHDARRR